MVLQYGKEENDSFYKSEYHIDQLFWNERHKCTFCIGKGSLYTVVYK